MARISRILAVPLCLMLTGANTKPWTAWERELSRNCPGRHVEWMCDSCHDEFLGAFYETLSPSEKRRMEAVADTRRACAREEIGTSCEMWRNVYAAQRLGLLHKLTAFGCRTVKCEEAALCSQFPQVST